MKKYGWMGGDDEISIDEITITCLTPSWWDLLKARLFGTRWTSTDTNCFGYQYKGVIYVTGEKFS